MLNGLFWILRRKIAEKTLDSLFVKIDEIQNVKTPLILRILKFKVVEIKNTSQNHMSFNGARWLIIRRDYDSLLVGSEMHVWRICGDDTNSAKPMVLWARYI
jgi:CO dehydrogenase/acetyl-CoA synthase gamma subunit (corrinoid Fe-S protein)